MAELYALTANRVFTEDDGITNTVAFRDDAQGADAYLLVQLAHEFSQEDLELGMNTVYLELGDEMRATYGGLTAIEVAPTSILFRLDSESAADLKVDGGIKIALDVEGPKLAEALERLAAIAADARVPIKPQ